MSVHMNHPYHLVENSPWPLTASLGVMMLTTGLVKWFYTSSLLLLFFGLLCVFLSSYQWWRDVVREGSFQGLHTIMVVSGLRMGMALFIVSEVLFFFSFFWAFFHSSLNPTMEIGGFWPPTGVVPFNCFQIPLLNTAILLSSGVTVTWSHHAVMSGNDSQGILGLFVTIMLGGYFTCLQAYEYVEASFCISDSVYGSTFFVATGFHGLHVIIGSIFLFVCLIRMYMGHFSSTHHVGYEASIWYWHFVDVVWLFLYVTIYWWGG